MEISGPVAVNNLNGEGRRARFPDRSDPRDRQGALFPEVRPRFTFEDGCRIFTIGSCFARNIEQHLTGYDLPTLRFSAPKAE